MLYVLYNTVCYLYCTVLYAVCIVQYSTLCCINCMLHVLYTVRTIRTVRTVHHHLIIMPTAPISYACPEADIVPLTPSWDWRACAAAAVKSRHGSGLLEGPPPFCGAMPSGRVAISGGSHGRATKRDAMRCDRAVGGLVGGCAFCFERVPLFPSPPPPPQSFTFPILSLVPCLFPSELSTHSTAQHEAQDSTAQCCTSTWNDRRDVTIYTFPHGPQTAGHLTPRPNTAETRFKPNADHGFLRARLIGPPFRPLICRSPVTRVDGTHDTTSRGHHESYCVVHLRLGTW